MSFYFSLETSAPFSPESVLRNLADDQVTYLEHVPDQITFFKPGKSLRGVCVYQKSGKIDIGLNAFTTRYDATLMRDIAAAIATALNSKVQPEDSETPISAADVAAYCDTTWQNTRYAEANSLIHPNAGLDGTELLTVAGYRRAFGFSQDHVGKLRAQGLSDDAIVANIMEDGMDVQEIDQTEDIFVPKLLELRPPAPPPVKPGFFASLFGKTAAAPQVGEPFVAFSLPENVRTLTPVNAASGPLFALLQSADGGYQRVPADAVVQAARAIQAREYGVGVFDLTLSGADYVNLAAKGEQM
ncbi:hypothetical protein SAMN04488515_0800 [Cognatiyoonia koreensis]|uniref:Uncharacterized protein n=1 Tax=Cognatiyoonia koreensis TaxID=364200 RepID=A0A1I0NSS6_9RHOB|nr:hypothetical protein [Cognatiyoonia koreensis]SEW04613.1 hypothetical protein SAMN04488515_0800 [Cognatiyoonia koreensis]